jgi:uncharacterized protein (DUF1330 family)
MRAYIIVDVAIEDTVQYEEYKRLTPSSILAFDGKFIVRGAPTETLEGDWMPKRFVMLEFPSKEKARAWWLSEMYAPAKSLRQRIAKTNMVLVEGFE